MPSFKNGVATPLNEPQLGWLDQTVDTFVAMSNLQSGSSILDHGCDFAVVALTVRNVG